MPRKKVDRIPAAVANNGKTDKTLMPLGYPSDPHQHRSITDPPAPKRMPHPDQLDETVHCGVSEVVFAFQTDRPELIKLYKPSGPVTADEAKMLAEFVRVLMQTNYSLRQSHKALERRAKELEAHCKAVQDGAVQLAGLSAAPPILNALAVEEEDE